MHLRRSNCGFNRGSSRQSRTRGCLAEGHSPRRPVLGRASSTDSTELQQDGEAMAAAQLPVVRTPAGRAEDAQNGAPRHVASASVQRKRSAVAKDHSAGRNAGWRQRTATAQCTCAGSSIAIRLSLWPAATAYRPRAFGCNFFGLQAVTWRGAPNRRQTLGIGGGTSQQSR